MTNEDIHDPTTLELPINNHTHGKSLFAAFLDDDPIAIAVGDTVIEDCYITDYDTETGHVSVAPLDDIAIGKQPTSEDGSPTMPDPRDLLGDAHDEFESLTTHRRYGFDIGTATFSTDTHSGTIQRILHDVGDELGVEITVDHVCHDGDTTKYTFTADTAGRQSIFPEYRHD